MSFYLIGVDYNTVSLALRESFMLRRREITEFWRRRRTGSAVLFTCNRIEVYGVAGNKIEAREILGSFRREFPEFGKNAYMRLGESEVSHHALRLAVGIESQMQAESQIMEQLWSWLDRSVAPGPLRWFWEKILAAAGRVREMAGLDEVSWDISSLVFEDMMRACGRSDLKIIVAGTGRVAQLCAQNRPAGVAIHFLSRKKKSRAGTLARKSYGRALVIEDIPEIIPSVDVLISATASPHVIFKTEFFKPLLAVRKKRLLMYDLAFPRDIDPALAGERPVVLKNLEDLKIRFLRHNAQIQEHICLAQDEINRIVTGLKRKELLSDVYANRYPLQPAGVTAGSGGAKLFSRCMV